VQAVKSASFSAKKGVITGLIGPNGAGKTSLFALLSGFEKPDSGTVLFKNQDITGLPAHKINQLGLARTFQIVQPFGGISVLENIMVGAYATMKSREQAIQHSEIIAEKLGLTAVLANSATSLTLAMRKRLEVARALATKPDLLLLDEVLAGLNPSEIRDILPILRNIKDEGVTILMIEHVMQAVMNLCDEVHVLVLGEIIASGTASEVVKNQAVITAYLGGAHAAS
jgi:branched-chain amino acid transport system ATP-binding protein